MDKTTELDKFVCPFGGQEVTLSQIEYEAGGMPLLRMRLREKHRFTIFEVDAATAEHWGDVLLRWAREQRAQVPRS